MNVIQYSLTCVGHWWLHSRFKESAFSITHFYKPSLLLHFNLIPNSLICHLVSSLNALFKTISSSHSLFQPNKLISSEELKYELPYLHQEIKLSVASCSYQEKQSWAKDRFYNPRLEMKFIWGICLPFFFLIIIWSLIIFFRFITWVNL